MPRGKGDYKTMKCGRPVNNRCRKRFNLRPSFRARSSLPAKFYQPSLRRCFNERSIHSAIPVRLRPPSLHRPPALPPPLPREIINGSECILIMSTMYNFSGIISVEYHHRGTGSQSPDDRWLFAHKLIPEMHLSRAHDPVRAKHRAPSVRRVVINARSSLSFTIIINN